MRKLVYFIILISLTETLYSQNKCIPYLLYRTNDAPIFIKYACVNDTLKLVWHATLTFKDTLKYPDPMVKSVRLNWLDIHPTSANASPTYLSRLDSIRAPFDQYIWDLCLAKFTYWYKEQPYKGWLEGQLEPEFKLYMLGICFMIPESPED